MMDIANSSNKNVLILKAKLKKNGFIEMVLSGKCMEPFLYAGDKSKIIKFDSCFIGDICLICLNDGSLALHRIIDIDNNDFITKGDFSGKAEHVAKENIIGKAIAFCLNDSQNWVSYDNVKYEATKVAKYSRMISPEFNNSKESRDEYRKKIWDMNAEFRNRFDKNEEK